MNILVNKLHYPVTVLGPGRRLGIWLQGCSIHCPGCVSRDTWPADPQHAIELGRLLDACIRLTGGQHDGVTISGGEPFDQPEALGALIDGLRALSLAAGRPVDVLCYSGYPFALLRERHAQVLARLDALIPEPYRGRRPAGGAWRGSDNQPLIRLSDLGRERFGDVAAEVGFVSLGFQVSVANGQIWYIGIPARGDMERLDRSARASGVRQEAVSWRS